MITNYTRVSSVIVFILLLSIIPMVGRAETVTVDSTIQIEINPTTLRLRPGEDGTISITVKNIGNEPTNVYFDMNYQETGGHADVPTDGIYFELNRSEQRVLRIPVSSQSLPHQDPEKSDMSMRLFYGNNLTLDKYDRVDLNTFDGQWSRTYNIDDDYLICDVLFISIILLVIASFIYIKRKRNLKRREITDENTEDHDNARIGRQ